MTNRRLRLSRIFLFLVLVAIGAAALFGVVVLLLGTLGDTGGRILLTCFTLGGASLAALTCALPLERERGRVVPISGVAAVHLAFACTVAGIWTDVFESKPYVRATLVIIIAAASLTHWNLISIPHLPLPAGSLVPALVALNLALSLVLSATALDLIEFDDAWGRFVGVLSILLAFGTIALPIAQRLGRASVAELATRERPEQIEIFCPRCQRRQKILFGSCDCSRCGLEIRVELGAWDDSLRAEPVPARSSESVAVSEADRESREPDSRG